MSISGVSSYSIMTLSPNINSIRTKVSDFPKMMQDLKLTPADISNTVAAQFLPDYGIKDLAPPIPQVNPKFEYQPVQFQSNSTEIQSTTSLLINQAKAIKAYSNAA